MPKRPPTTEVSPSELNYMHDVEGMSIRKIAEKLDCCPATVAKYLDRRRKRVSDDDILELRRQGLSVTEIGRKLGCSDVTVVNRLKKLGEYEPKKRKATNKKKIKVVQTPIVQQEPEPEEDHGRVFEGRVDGARYIYYKGQALITGVDRWLSPDELWDLVHDLMILRNRIKNTACNEGGDL